MSPRSPERSVRHSIAAHAMWARVPNRAARLANAHAGVEAHIARQYGVPADLPPAEYAKCIASAKHAYFKALAQKSVKARKAKIAARQSPDTTKAGSHA